MGSSAVLHTVINENKMIDHTKGVRGLKMRFFLYGAVFDIVGHEIDKIE